MELSPMLHPPSLQPADTGLLEALGAVIAAGLIFYAAFRIGSPLVASLLRRAPESGIRWVEEPVPSQWPRLLHKVFPASRALAPEDRERLLRMMQVFLRDTAFEGAGGFEINDRVRVSVAAQACYLVLGMNRDPYPDTRRVIVYPETFVPRRPTTTLDFELVEEGEGPTLGESWHHGAVILSWPSVKAGSRDPEDGWNVVFHEFAHQLDQGDGEGGGMPVDVPQSLRPEWARVVQDRLAEMRSDLAQGIEPYLDDYAATNEAEFFAVAVEAFYELPGYLWEADPELYDLLAAYFMRDPAREWGLLEDADDDDNG
jgi:Mlc titration factor MtfA (ptsG expression regulator)